MRRIEHRLEQGLFASRWLAAPIFVGLVFCLVMLLVVFARYLFWVGSQLLTMTVHDAAVATLAFIDLALIANLVLIVIFVGYDNFVSRLDIADHADRPSWIGDVDFTGLKMKLFSSLVAITGIDLLKAFMDLQHQAVRDTIELRWLVIIHVTFLFTLTFSAIGNWFVARSKAGKG
jgi:uncharacterized protein (TIGR00645 family)